MASTLKGRDCDHNGRVMDVVRENIERLMEHHEKRRANRPRFEKLADAITSGIGTMTSVVVHASVFATWIVLNLGVFGNNPFDPFPFGLLTMLLSIEAIFLTLFVLISQNRMQFESDSRSELDVQINLLTEYELTRLWRLTELIADKLGVDRESDEELQGLDVDIDPQDVIQQIEEVQENGPKDAAPSESS